MGNQTRTTPGRAPRASPGPKVQVQQAGQIPLLAGRPGRGRAIHPVGVGKAGVGMGCRSTDAPRTRARRDLLDRPRPGLSQRRGFRPPRQGLFLVQACLPRCAGG